MLETYWTDWCRAVANDEKRAHLTDLRREHLIDKVCIQEILPTREIGHCRQREPHRPNPSQISARDDRRVLRPQV